MATPKRGNEDKPAGDPDPASSYLSGTDSFLIGIYSKAFLAKTNIEN